MREILFRGKALDGGKWVTGWYVEACFGSWPLEPAIIPSEDAKRGCYRPVAVHPSTVGQFTGLYDKDGKRIFEGDIIKIEFDNRQSDELPPIWYDTALVHFSEKYHGWYAKFADDELSMFEYDDLSIVEVIGNRWDNSELLK